MRKPKPFSPTLLRKVQALSGGESVRQSLARGHGIAALDKLSEMINRYTMPPGRKRRGTPLSPEEAAPHIALIKMHLVRLRLRQEMGQ